MIKVAIIQYVIVVTQGKVHCLICIHDAQGRAVPEGGADISGNARFPELQLICYTFSEAAVFIC